MRPPVSQSITRRSASNLALAFVLLPRERRGAMAALYAFCREIDDVADDESVPVAERRRRLAAWREDLRLACATGEATIAVNRELVPVVRRYRLAAGLFEELLDGVEMDLEVHRYATYADLEAYCYRVASVVGLLSIEIFGYRHAACREYAVALGKALQFTNILRDVRNDAERGRVYLPGEELERAGCSVESVLRAEYTPAFRVAAARFADRARGFYRAARETLPVEDRRSMVAAELMGAVYWRLLLTLEQRGFDVFGPGLVRVGKLAKVGLVLRTWLQLSLGGGAPSYGAT